jgi:Ran GTPase-activating protein (RanGAP) involved in mRNA processing and transport
LETYRPLQYLDLSSNRIDWSSADSLSRLLKNSKTLKELNLHCNKLGAEAGNKILEGIRKNEALLKLDIRFVIVVECRRTKLVNVSFL